VDMDKLCSKRNRVNAFCVGYVFSAQKPTAHCTTLTCGVLTW